MMPKVSTIDETKRQTINSFQIKPDFNAMNLNHHLFQTNDREKALFHDYLIGATH